MRYKKQTPFLALALTIAAFGSILIAPSVSAKLECSVLPQYICDESKTGDLENSGTWLLLIFVLQIMTALVGIISVGAITYAGFLYASAQDNAQQTKQALDMIRNTVIGILTYGLMWAGLQYLIPGGIFA